MMSPFAFSATIRLYVSRGGLKLARALEHWQVDVAGKTCVDIGASTGGFTDCLLQHGAARVIAVDTGYGQMDAGLRDDPRVRLLEKTNARYLTAEQLWPDGERQAIALLVMDVSFISATLVLPAVVGCAFAPQRQISNCWCWSSRNLKLAGSRLAKAASCAIRQRSRRQSIKWLRR